LEKGSFYINYVKPLLSYAAALLLLVLLSPLFIFIMLVLAVTNNGEVFFFQKRVGYNEKIFWLLKFKTLKDIKDASGKMLPDAERQFALGTFLRHYHLDEMPQLFNVLKGDLNFIGPRPLLVEYLPYYTAEQRKRHLRKPGMTGLAQSLGGNMLNWHQRFRLDCFYAEKCSFALDIRIVMLTIRYFLKKRSDKNIQSLFSESFIDYQLQFQKRA
jgi:lipopolysaccharide/colanic/teichoic acid biosynthesis glycosyltransferase